MESQDIFHIDGSEVMAPGSKKPILAALSLIILTHHLDDPISRLQYSKDQ